MGAPTLHIALLERDDARLPFVHDLVDLMGLRRDVTVADVLSSFEPTDVDLLVVARSVWTAEDTETCASLNAARSGVPLLGISGPIPVAVRAAALRAGADDLVSIPFDVDELTARAFALVRLSARPGLLRRGAFVVETTRRRISLDGTILPLTLAEYDILATLIAGSGAVVTRQALASSIGSAAASDSNVVDVHISRMREKLGRWSSAIETIRGKGYRFRPG